MAGRQPAASGISRKGPLTAEAVQSCTVMNTHAGSCPAQPYRNTMNTPLKTITGMSSDASSTVRSGAAAPSSRASSTPGSIRPPGVGKG